MTTPFTLSPLIEDFSLAYRLRPAEGEARGQVILLHGFGSNEASLAGLAFMFPSDIAVVLVRFPIPLGPDSFGAFAVKFTSDGPHIDTFAAESSRQTLIQFIEELQAHSGIPPARTLIAGFSQGGIMSAGIALTRPDQVAGFAILSGRILPEIIPLLAAPTALSHLEGFIAHGEHDDRLPLAWAKRSAALLENQGIRYEQKRYGAGHEITLEMASDFVTWSTGLLYR
ncbi:MAG: alpha/beta hydrolase [Actinomycetota bacterium]